MQTQTMTFEEQMPIRLKAIELRKAGDEEGYINLMKTVPLAPYLAKVFKDKFGADDLIQGGWNLSEAEAEFGEDWLNR